MKMNIVLIIVGAILLGAGVIMTFTSRQEETASAPLEVDEIDVAKKETSAQDKEMAASQENVIVTPQEKETASNSETEAKQKGNAFEDYIADMLSDCKLRIKEWNKGTVTDNGAFGENALNPDMFIADNDNKLEYWVECKYRSNVPSGGFQVEDYQLKRYAEKQKATHRKVLIALGVGGRAAQPEKVYIIPVDTIMRYKHIPDKYLSRYQLDSNTPGAIRSHIIDYFHNDVFKRKQDSSK